MKWIGQHIYDLTSRFRNDVFLEDISTGTIASGAHLGLDSNNKIVKAADGGGDITGVTAGTNLSGGGTSGAVTINLADASTSAKGAASFSSDNFAASSGAITIKDGGVDLTAEVTGVLPSANMDGDTAHLTTNQTLSGVKTFSAPIISDGDRTLTPGDGAAIHVDAFDVTDGATSESATTAAYRHVSIESPRLLATNSSVTTTDAATLYVKGPPVASTNQTITNAYALWVDNGNARFDGDVDVDGTLETDALTVGGTNVLTGSLITTLGTISAGVWNGTRIASANLDTDTAHLSGTQTFTGAKTFNEDIIGKTTKERWIKNIAYVVNAGTTEYFIPMVGASENTNEANATSAMVMPAAGKLLKAHVRSSIGLGGSSNEVTVKMINWDADESHSSSNDSIMCAVTIDGWAGSTFGEFDFTGTLDSGVGAESAAFTANEILAVGIKHSAAMSNAKYFVTLVFEMDWAGY
tara:strand:- start:17 stop:1417 length:1401 start_codon:yes stop_codon:yes gene_type:complete